MSRLSFTFWQYAFFLLKIASRLKEFSQLGSAHKTADRFFLLFFAALQVTKRGNKRANKQEKQESTICSQKLVCHM